ncbi:MAG: hypothetical protein PHF67_02605 [Candidatus Nanoarchaeia archaeon]|nr:hypothetical protein [Candidatus Nanoarchaeia archaeon]
MIKQNLISRLGAGLLIATAGLVGLTGCAATQESRVPRDSYSQEYAQPSQVQANPQNQESDDADFGMAVIGGFLGTSGHPVARGIGNGMLAYSTKPKTQVNVNVNGQPQSGVVYVPIEPKRTIDDRLLPDYDLDELSKELRERKVSGESADPTFGGIYSIVTSRNVADLNGDNLISPNEFVGLGTNFTDSRKPVNITVFIDGCYRNPFARKPSEYELTCELYDGKGKRVSKRVHSGKLPKYGGGNVLNWTESELKPGVYTVRAHYTNSLDTKKKHPSERNAVFQVLEDK